MDTEDNFQLSPQEMRERMLEMLENMDSDARLACEKMMHWMADNPKEWAQFTNEDFFKMAEETRLEIIRRRLGGTVGKVIQFKKFDSEK
jgi:hypothetical protein